MYETVVLFLSEDLKHLCHSRLPESRDQVDTGPTPPSVSPGVPSGASE